MCSKITNNIHNIFFPDWKENCQQLPNGRFCHLPWGRILRASSEKRLETCDVSSLVPGIPDFPLLSDSDLLLLLPGSKLWLFGQNCDFLVKIVTLGQRLPHHLLLLPPHPPHHHAWHSPSLHHHHPPRSEKENLSWRSVTFQLSQESGVMTSNTGKVDFPVVLPLMWSSWSHIVDFGGSTLLPTDFVSTGRWFSVRLWSLR